MKLETIVNSCLQVSVSQLKSDAELVRDIQQRLGISVDGEWGPETEKAILSFCKSCYLDNADTGIFGKTFAAKLLAHRGGILPNWKGGDKEATINAIVDFSRRYKLTNPQIAYVLATVQHETAGSFQPVEEGYYLGSRSAEFQKSLRYYPYYGKGYVQLTWKANYLKYGQKLGLDLVGNPDLALRPDIALFVLVDGMKTGAFTGHKLETHINGSRCDFVNARRIINGMDCAPAIAGIAKYWNKSKLLMQV